MYFFDNDIESETLLSGATRKIKGYIDDLMVCELTFMEGMVGDIHKHPNRQCGYVIKGKFMVNVDGEEKKLNAGDCFYAEKDIPHGLKCLEDNSVLLDIFTPMREDFIK